MPITTTRRFVLGTALAAAAAAHAGRALQGATADPYAGGSVLSGAGTTTTVLDVSDASFGGRGDAVLLGDLTVTAGSTAISSPAAPFVSTDRDRGKLVIWRGSDDSVGTGVIASVQSTTAATLTAAASISSRADGGPNTNGAIGTDNTDAFNAALRAAQAASARTPADRRGSIPVVEVHVPRGVFLIRALDTVQQAGITVSGEGRFSSFIASASSGAWLSLSEYSAGPSDAFQGTASGWTFQDLHFINPCFRNGSSEGKRTGRAVQDNGSGGTRLLGCGFTGLSYGFCGAYGSDFSTIRDCVFYLCDTGYYFGPGSQQLGISKTDAALCREGAVFEGAPHWHIGGASSFEDPTVSAVTIEAKASGSTRLGVPVALGGAYYAGLFLIDGGTWFETNSGTNGRVAPRMVLMKGDGPFQVPAQGLTIRDAYFIAGGQRQQGGTNCFVEYSSAMVSEEPVAIEDLVVSGEFANAVFRMSGTAKTSSPRLAGITRPDGVALLQGPSGGAKILERDGSLTWALRITPPSPDAVALQLQRSGTGTAPLLAARGQDSDRVLSGIAAGGALLEAFVSTASTGGLVRLDASRCNYFSCRTSGAVQLSIVNAPATSTQRLTVEVIAVGADRAITWPDNCRFARGEAPPSARVSTRTSVTFLRDPRTALWIEAGRATDVPL